MDKTLRVLLVEDRDDDAELLQREFRKADYQTVCKRVESAEEMGAALRQESWDIIVSDYALPGFGAMPALEVAKNFDQDIPFIIVSGTIDEEMAVAALKAGASDFVSKARLARFLPAVERELREVAVRRERHAAEAAFRESERKYRQIVETAREGIWVVDSQTKTVFVNRQMADMLGASPDKILLTPFEDYFDEVWRSAALEALKPPREAASHQSEFRVRRRDGREFWGAFSISPRLDEEGRCAGALAMVTDVTERRRLQEQVMIADRMASVGLLAAGVAHEINNPLAVILGYIELALRDLDGFLKERGTGTTELSRVHGRLRDIQEAALRVQNIVRDLRVFSRGDEEKREPVNVHQVLDSSARMARNEIRHRAVLARRYEDVPPVLANESRLGQVFLNLIVNAAQSIPEGNASGNEIQLITETSRDGQVIVKVQDTGCGMSSETVRQLFTPFFTTKPVGVGTGLGLSICHRIITSLGGEIRVISAVGKGSTFEIVLPAAPQEAVRSQPKAAPALGPSSRGRILVVDDEEMIVNLLKDFFSDEHEVSAETEAAAALSRFQAGERFDLILCDLMMPHVTGMDLFAKLEEIAPDQATRMVFLTGGTFTPRARTFLDQTRNPWVEKPFQIDALRAVINERLKGS